MNNQLFLLYLYFQDRGRPVADDHDRVAGQADDRTTRGADRGVTVQAGRDADLVEGLDAVDLDEVATRVAGLEGVGRQREAGDLERRRSVEAVATAEAVVDGGPGRHGDRVLRDGRGRDEEGRASGGKRDVHGCGNSVSREVEGTGRVRAGIS